MDKREAKKIVEAALFITPNYLTIEELSKLVSLPISETRIILNELIHEYDAKETALEIRHNQEGAKMAVKPFYENFVSHLAAAPEMHKGMLKTLAFIAYKQPVKQSEVIHFRNNKAYDHISTLLEKGFIKREKKGTTFILTTTPKFKEYFGTSLENKSQQN
ncbi:MAG: SMC-Scp complex subunit ScpB [Candidatus Diapherotrites archaeon]